MKHERPPSSPTPGNDPKDLLMGRIIDQLYHLKHRVERLQWVCALLFGALVLVALPDLLAWLK